ncbi:MAG: sensor histidine kinase [Myxococcales bacterium]
MSAVRLGGSRRGEAVERERSILEERQRLREEWTSLIAHDLRQPLCVITSSATLVRRLAARRDFERLDRALDQLQRASCRLDRMIGDLADLSRIVTGRLQLEPKPVELCALAGEVVERQRILHPGRAIRIDAATCVVRIRADPGRIEQVLENLLSNAVKYGSPNEPIGVEVRSAEREVGVKVTNGGPEIPRDELPNLFRRYYRTADARAHPQEGLGLGLYIARGIVEAHGGRIWAESRPGETAFRFALPR